MLASHTSDAPRVGVAQNVTRLLCSCCCCCGGGGGSVICILQPSDYTSFSHSFRRQPKIVK